MGNFALFKTKFDIYALAVLVLVGGVAFNLTQTAKPTGDNLVANVYVSGEQVDALSLSFPQTYIYYAESNPSQIAEVEKYLPSYQYRPLASPYGEKLLGAITVAVKEGKVAVVDETSLHHYCRIQGATDTPNWPITCAPNYFVIIIEEASA